MKMWLSSLSNLKNIRFKLAEGVQRAELGYKFLGPRKDYSKDLLTDEGYT